MPPLPATDDAVAILDRALAGSPADRTEISWLGAHVYRQETGGKRGRSENRRDERVAVRVVERGRVGTYRAQALELGAIETAIRQALAIARLAPPPPHPIRVDTPPDAGRVESSATSAAPLYDDELAQITPEMAREIFRQGLAADESARLAWCVGSLAFGATGERTRAIRITGAMLDVRAGRGPATGSASAAARTLGGLFPGDLLDRARERRAPDELVEPVEGALPILLAPAAVARLVAALGDFGLASRALDEGLSPLGGRIGEVIVSPFWSLTDDATDPEGLPLPFDLRGRATAPVELIERGTLRSLAWTAEQAAARALVAPPLAVSFDDARPTHLSLSAAHGGGVAEGDLRSRAGLEIAAFEPLEMFDPRRLRFRTVAHGVRRLDDGSRAAIRNLPVEADLLSLLSRVAAVGSERETLAFEAPLLGALRTPALLLEAGALAPLR